MPNDTNFTNSINDEIINYSAKIVDHYNGSKCELLNNLIKIN